MLEQQNKTFERAMRTVNDKIRKLERENKDSKFLI